MSALMHLDILMSRLDALDASYNVSHSVEKEVVVMFRRLSSPRADRIV